MRLRLFIVFIIIVLIVVACQGPPPTQYVIVVTATPSGNSAQAAPSATATLTTPLAPTITPTLDPFPTPTVNQIQVAEERFQNGRMFWLRPTDQIWVMMNGTDANSGKWSIYNNSFIDGEQEFDPSIVAPQNLFQPIRGFGKLWRENPEIKQALGWATETEYGHVTCYEYHAGGTVNAQNQYIKGPGYHILKSLFGDWFQFNEADGTWQRINPKTC
jgi:hypothetical protein